MASCESVHPPALDESGNSSPAVEDVVVATKSNVNINTETTHDLSSGSVPDVVGVVGAKNTSSSELLELVQTEIRRETRWWKVQTEYRSEIPSWQVPTEIRREIQSRLEIIFDAAGSNALLSRMSELERELFLQCDTIGPESLRNLALRVCSKLSPVMMSEEDPVRGYNIPVREYNFLVREYNILVRENYNGLDARKRMKNLVENTLLLPSEVVRGVIDAVKCGRINRNLTMSTAAAGTLFQTGDVEAGELIIGNTFGVGWGEISPSNHDVRMVIDLPQTEDSPLHPSVNISKSFDSVLGYDANLTYFKVMFSASQILGMACESIYDGTGVKPYAYGTVACFGTAACAVRLLATREGGKSTSNREQFAVYFRGASFLLVEGLLQSGLDQGHNVTALKTLIRVADMVINWWVLGELRSYGKAFRKCLPF